MESSSILFLIFIGQMVTLNGQNCPELCLCLPDIISCDDVNLKKLPYSDSDSLTTLNLSNCTLSFDKLSRRNTEIYKHGRIKEFSIISRNRLLSVTTNAFVDMKDYLKRLEISTRTVEDHSFEKLSLDDRLTLDGLEKLPKFAFSGLKNVNSIELINGKLKDFPIEDLIRLADSSKLNSLSIMGNEFTHLPEEYDKLFGKLQRIDLSNNPWHCDCSLAWLIRRYKTKPHPFNEPKCNSPPHLKGKSFKDLLTHVDEPREESEEFILLCSRLNIEEINVNIEDTSEENKKVLISCKVSATKHVNIEWFRQSDKIMTSPLFEIFQDSNREELVWENTISGPVRISERTRVVSTLTASKIDNKDNYSCRVSENGSNSISASIKIKWPEIDNSLIVPMNQLSETLKIPTLKDNYSFNYVKTSVFKKQFSLIELLGGVIGTFLFTTLLFILGYQFSKKYSPLQCCKYQNTSLHRKFNRSYVSSNVPNAGSSFDDYLKHLSNLQTYFNHQTTNNPNNNTSPIGTDSTNISNTTQKDYLTNTIPPQNHQQNNFQTNPFSGVMQNKSAANFILMQPGNGMVFPNTQTMQNGYEIYAENNQNHYDIPGRSQEPKALLYSSNMNPMPISAPPPLFMSVNKQNGKQLTPNLNNKNQEKNIIQNRFISKNSCESYKN